MTKMEHGLATILWGKLWLQMRMSGETNGSKGTLVTHGNTRLRGHLVDALQVTNARNHCKKRRQNASMQLRHERGNAIPTT